MKNELVKSPVQFIENRTEGMHHYVLGIDELTGVTSILNAVIFRDKYTGIDADVLRNAADRGTAIHEAVQSYLTGKEFDLPEDLQPFMIDAVQARGAWLQDEHRTFMTAAAVEYLVSDCKEVASKIDVVIEDGDGYAIADIKTTYQLDREYLSWQLSVYKYLFERQNPNSKVTKLLAFWYNRQRKDWQIITIEDKGTSEVERLFNAWRNNEFWGVSDTHTEYPAPVLSLAQFYADLEAQIKEATAKRDEFRERLQTAMQENNIQQIKTDGFTCTLVAGGTRASTDTKTMLADHPELNELFRQYERIAQVKPSIKITLKK